MLTIENFEKIDGMTIYPNRIKLGIVKVIVLNETYKLILSKGLSFDVVIELHRNPLPMKGRKDDKWMLKIHHSFTYSFPLRTTQLETLNKFIWTIEKLLIESGYDS